MGAYLRRVFKKYGGERTWTYIYIRGKLHKLYDGFLVGSDQENGTVRMTPALLV